MPKFIRKHFNKSFYNLYDFIDGNYIEELRGRIFSISSAKKENEIENSKYTLALKRYADFLQSKIYKSKEKIKKMENEHSVAVHQSTDIKRISPKIDPLQPDELYPEIELSEGALRQVNITKRERNKELRQLCLYHYGYECQCCGMNFK